MLYFMLLVVGLRLRALDWNFQSEDLEVKSASTDFTLELSRDLLRVPHNSTHQFVKAGLCYVKKSKSKTYC